MHDQILAYLRTDPRFRERSNKNKGIANVIMLRYDIKIPMDKRAEFISDILSADRSWRKHLEENPDLRGEDYKDKDVLEQKKEIELGYTPGYQADLKLSKKI